MIRCLPLALIAASAAFPVLARPAPVADRAGHIVPAQLAGKFDDEKIGFWSVNVSVDGTPRIASAQRLCEAVKEPPRSR